MSNGRRATDRVGNIEQHSNVWDGMRWGNVWDGMRWGVQVSTPRANREHKVRPQAGTRLVKKRAPFDLSNVFVTGVEV